MKELNNQQLQKLKQHTYSCSNCSLLDPIMQKWWNWLILQFPMTIAPNLITIVGLFINVITSLLLVYYSPYADQEVPRWACLLCCLGLFTYQSLDAIDGKQARRTNTSSPLGELFDHGCDSLSTVFVSISVCCAVQLGTQPYWLFCQCMMAVGLFYCAHWQTYVSGQLRFGLIDVTEAQFGVMVILLISSIFGSNIWSTKVPIVELSMKCFPTIFGSTAGSIALFNNFKIILIERGAGRNGSTVALPLTSYSIRSLYILMGLSNFALTIKNYVPCILYKGIGKNGSSVASLGMYMNNVHLVVACLCYQLYQLRGFVRSTLTPGKGGGPHGATVAGTSVLSPIVPLLLFVVPALMVAWKSTNTIFLSNPLLYMFTFGFVAARVTNRLVVAHMTKHEMAYTDSSMIGPAVLLLNQFFNSVIPEYWLLWAVFFYVTYDLVRYCRAVCLEICDFLNIELFRISPPGVSNGSASKYDVRSKAKAKHN